MMGTGPSRPGAGLLRVKKDRTPVPAGLPACDGIGRSYSVLNYFVMFCLV